MESKKNDLPGASAQEKSKSKGSKSYGGTGRRPHNTVAPHPNQAKVVVVERPAPAPAKKQAAGGPPVSEARERRTQFTRSRDTKDGMVFGAREFVGDVIVLTGPSGNQPDAQELQEVMPSISQAGYGTNTPQLNVINPTNAALFQGAAQVASLFEKYRMKSLRFVYEPTVGTSADGSILLSYDADPADNGNLAESPYQKGAPANKRDILDMQGARSGPVWERHTLEVKRSHMGGEFYIFGETASNQTNRFEQAGLFYIFATGASIGTIGELWVEYEFEFLIRQNHLDEVLCSGSFGGANMPGANLSQIFGGKATLDSGNHLVRYVTWIQSAVVYDAIELTLPGNYIVEISLTGSSLSDVVLSLGAPVFGAVTQYLLVNGASTRLVKSWAIAVGAAPTCIGFLCAAGSVLPGGAAYVSVSRLYPGQVGGTGASVPPGPPLFRGKMVPVLTAPPALAGPDVPAQGPPSMREKGQARRRRR